jgi:formate-dependent nitrite reductase cytochrome c552 subunit
MYVGVLGVFADPNQPVRYERVALDSRFQDSEEMLASLKVYQDRLKDAYTRDWTELGLKPISHASGQRFVGSQACKDCHEQAYDIWRNSPHFEATKALAIPTERSSIPRHFDPECLSCHVTGWHPQDYLPYATGYAQYETSKHLHGSGCENCHGPGSGHVAAENGEGDFSEAQRAALLKGMQLPLANAQQHCLQCHDLDNDPHFQEDGAFEKYWEKIKHYE